VTERSADWMRQATRDLEHARTVLAAGFFEWSCFSAHQSAEKAIKAVIEHRHGEAWGHGLHRLLAELNELLPENLLDRAKVLDKHYIPTRYPNGLESGAPTDLYTRGEAVSAIEHAEAILQFCSGLLPRP
jgi:HEPN domain-containing protein